MTYLIDTSAWINHFRHGDEKLEEVLRHDNVLSHPYVIGELGLGHLKDRKETLSTLLKLPQAKMPSFEEVMTYIESNKLYGSGLGWVDIVLIISAKLSASEIFTKDKNIMKIWNKLN